MKIKSSETKWVKKKKILSYATTFGNKTIM
jgi:hypothetical protein